MIPDSLQPVSMHDYAMLICAPTPGLIEDKKTSECSECIKIWIIESLGVRGTSGASTYCFHASGVRSEVFRLSIQVSRVTHGQPLLSRARSKYLDIFASTVNATRMYKAQTCTHTHTHREIKKNASLYTMWSMSRSFKS